MERSNINPHAEASILAHIVLAFTEAGSLYRISKSGNYLLPGSVVGVAGKAGIEIAASNVTIDLGGHALIGVASSLHGVKVASQDASEVYNITIRNGSVTGWSNGILLQEDVAGSTTAETALIENIQASYNRGFGIHGGPRAVIRNSTALFNQGVGIYVSGTAENCASTGNRSYGFLVSEGTVRGSVASENLSHGFCLNTDSLVKESTATENRGAGFHALSRVTIESCVASKNETWGFYSEFPFFRVTESTASENEAGGIKVLGEAPVVEGNAVTQRSLDEIGIYVGGARASVQSNTVRGGALGIFGTVGASDAVFTNNSVAEANLGFRIKGVHNVVGGNLSRNADGYNYQISASDRAGTRRSSALSGEINGASTALATGAGATQPWVNLSY